MTSTWPLTLRTILIALAIGFASGVLGSAFTAGYLSDYASELGKLREPLGLSAVRPQGFPKSYEEARANILQKVMPAIGSVYAGQLAQPLGRVVAVTSDGWLVSTQGAVGKSGTLRVRLNRKTYSVVRSEEDKVSGIVFLKIEAENLPVVAFGEGLKIRPADQVFVIPQPDVLVFSVLNGFDWLDLSVARASEQETRLLLVQESLAADQLGSPVVSLSGELLGIVQMAGDRPRAQATEVILPGFVSLLKQGKIVRPYLGVHSIDLSQSSVEESSSRGLTQGALLAGSVAVEQNSPAMEAGLRRGDILLSFAGQTFDGRKTLAEYLMERSSGDTVTIVFDRAGEQREVQVTLGAK